MSELTLFHCLVGSAASVIIETSSCSNHSRMFLPLALASLENPLLTPVVSILPGVEFPAGGCQTLFFSGSVDSKCLL